MRYSILVYLIKMSKTLLEAARYLSSAPEADPLRTELLENGRKMIEQIHAELKRNQEDLISELPEKYMETVSDLWGDGGAELEAALCSFAECLPHEVQYQVRAVFFAELGEKWDSMESVYWYMREDPRFDPVVVLTPIFRQVQKNGKVEQEVIYKDYLTAMGIPFFEYNKYSLEEDCPDLAFISQPYEGCTPREFWPKYIAQHTRLVYCTYAINGQLFEDSADTLCLLPVFRYAWRVPGASERHYQFYSKHAVNGGSNMLVTGVPKFDPVIRLRDKPAEIPEAWKPALKGRKVILWNTWYSWNLSSVGCFDQLVDWLRKHDDCAIIWRPHPMTHTVTKLHYPTLYTQLQNNIALAKELPNMVYDDHPAYEAAFSCSNAMISDFSSMMYQYLLLDKPVLWIRQKKANGPFSGKMQTNNFIVDWRWMEEAENVEGIMQFLERIRQNADLKADTRKTVLQRDLPLADGRCGERLCETLWTELHREDL